MSEPQAAASSTETPAAAAVTTTATSETTKAKKCYILRGISGSGKSTLSKKILEENAVTLPENLHYRHIFSADNYFVNRQTGKYEYDAAKIGAAHGWCQRKSFEAMERGTTPIIIDNTNTQLWEMKVYVEEALKHGYSVELREPETPWKKDAKELAKRNVHGVPEEAINRMLSRWEHGTVEDIRKAVPPKHVQKRANRGGRGGHRGGGHAGGSGRGAPTTEESGAKRQRLNEEGKAATTSSNETTQG